MILDLTEHLLEVEYRGAMMRPEPPHEPEIVNCSCGETFDWENWDRGTFPVPKGVMEAVRHLDMGHTIGTPKEPRADD